MKKRIAILILSSAILLSLFCVFASAEPAKLVDDAELLTDSQEKALVTRLDAITENRRCEIAIITVTSTEGKSSLAFADDYFDYNGYGYGTGDDGILLLVDMGGRETAISTYGKGQKAVTDDGLDYLFDGTNELIGDGDYYGGLSEFITRADHLLELYEAGTPYESKVGPGTLIIISLLIGVVAALIILLVMKGKMKSVRSNNFAGSYVVANSLNMRVAREMFLFVNVSKVRRQSESSDGGSTHISSSGRSHGGGSRGF